MLTQASATRVRVVRASGACNAETLGRLGLVPTTGALRARGGTMTLGERASIARPARPKMTTADLEHTAAHSKVRNSFGVHARCFRVVTLVFIDEHMKVVISLHGVAQRGGIKFI